MLTFIRVFVFLILGCSQAYAAVTVHDTGTEVYKAASTTFSSSAVINVTAGANTLVCTVTFGYSGSAPTGVAATWNGVSMTTLASINQTGGVAANYVFGLRSPATGANAFSLGTWTNSAEVFAVCVSFSGVDTTSNLTAFPHQATLDTGIGSTVAVTSATGNIVIASEQFGSSVVTLTGTTIFRDVSNGAFINAGSNYDNGAATVNIGVSAGTQTTIAATDVGASGGGGPTCNGGLPARGAGVC